MTKKQAIKHFGTASKLAFALGLKRQAVHQWGKRPPLLRQYQIHELTGLPIDKPKR